MKQTVYFLGAGFSAPAGLPVISDFMFRAREQFSLRPDEYSLFKNVFDYIDSLSRAKNFTNIDLFNVEEIYSDASMHELFGRGLGDEFQQFIKDVVKHYTPEFRRHEHRLQGAAFDVLFAATPQLRNYINFIAQLLNICFKLTESAVGVESAQGLSYNDFTVTKAAPVDATYCLVTLNYDTIVEGAVDFLKKNFGAQPDFRPAKLHGSVDGVIVPPTWQKKINSELIEAWKNAAEWLRDANEIRILGYSLPQTDVYIKHLFSTALLESKNLQKIDVICLDPDGSVRKRYEKMFTFPRFEFFDENISDYLAGFSTWSSDRNRRSFWGGNPEEIHERWTKAR